MGQRRDREHPATLCHGGWDHPQETVVPWLNPFGYEIQGLEAYIPLMTGFIQTKALWRVSQPPFPAPGRCDGDVGVQPRVREAEPPPPPC